MRRIAPVFALALLALAISNSSACAADGAGGAAAIGMGLSVLGIGLGLGLIGYGALVGIARQPESAGTIQSAMFIIGGLVEGAGIISLVLCLVTIFV